MLDLLRRRLADDGAVVAADIADDRFIESVASNAHRLGVDDTVEGDHRDLGGAAANVEHHRAAGVAHRQPRPDRGRHRLFDEVNVAGASTRRGFANRPAFDLGGPARHADEHPRARPEEAVLVGLVNEVLQHLFGHREVGDHTVLQWPDGLDVARRTSKHALRGLADRRDALAAPVPVSLTDGDDGWLVQYDPGAARIDECVGGAEIDREIIGEQTPKTLEHERVTTERRLPVAMDAAYNQGLRSSSEAGAVLRDRPPTDMEAGCRRSAVGARGCTVTGAHRHHQVFHAVKPGC